MLTLIKLFAVLHKETNDFLLFGNETSSRIYFLMTFLCLQGATIISNLDFSTIEAHDKVVAALDGTKVDFVLSDMAPSATGIKELDKDRIIGLCYMAIRFAALVSKIDGGLLIKVWDGKEVPILEMDLEKFYSNIRIMKPLASRSESSEKFILARGFKGIQRPLQNGRWG